MKYWNSIRMHHKKDWGFKVNEPSIGAPLKRPVRNRAKRASPTMMLRNDMDNIIQREITSGVSPIHEIKIINEILLLHPGTEMRTIKNNLYLMMKDYIDANFLSPRVRGKDYFHIQNPEDFQEETDSP